MKNIPIVIIVVAVLVFTWDLFWWAMGVEPLLPYRLKNALTKNPEAFNLIDVRTQTEYGLFHIDRSSPDIS